ncbi:hypothetical protein CRE_05147 [Caenorhabditis remanei]|uniref:Uncharacterized protein n=1 Tax=Caenorhabditis remanei TaxID=31234 RepID=E3N6B6_CAERE|nr:hypothetical protein CRE_05147 [Caenorhabditis remanei]
MADGLKVLLETVINSNSLSPKDLEHNTRIMENAQAIILELLAKKALMLNPASPSPSLSEPKDVLVSIFPFVKFETQRVLQDVNESVGSTSSASSSRNGRETSIFSSLSTSSDYKACSVSSDNSIRIQSTIESGSSTPSTETSGRTTESLEWPCEYQTFDDSKNDGRVDAIDKNEKVLQLYRATTATTQYILCKKGLCDRCGEEKISRRNWFNCEAS